MGAYLLAQQATLAQLLVDWRMIDGTTPEAEPGPAVLRHCFQPPDEGWVIQYQAYWFFGERVAVLTVTAPFGGGRRGVGGVLPGRRLVRARLTRRATATRGTRAARWKHRGVDVALLWISRTRFR
jgi:hypothetical protein